MTDRYTPPRHKPPQRPGELSSLFQDCVVKPILFTACLAVGVVLACTNFNERGPGND